MNRVLRLRLLTRYFGAIAKGEKKSEYRDQTPYWMSRLAQHGHLRKFDEVHFTNGYGKDRPFMRVACEGIFDWIGLYYEIRLGKILEIKNWETIIRTPAISAGVECPKENVGSFKR